MPIPPGNHSDWPKLFRWVPRKWTAIEYSVPPVKIAGTERVEDNLDIPERGRWALAGIGNLKIPVYFALTTKTGWHFRIGLFRFDYSDFYYQVGTFKIGKYNYKDKS